MRLTNIISIEIYKRPLNMKIFPKYMYHTKLWYNSQHTFLSHTNSLVTQQNFPTSPFCIVHKKLQTSPQHTKSSRKMKSRSKRVTIRERVFWMNWKESFFWKLNSDFATTMFGEKEKNHRKWNKNHVFFQLLSCVQFYFLLVLLCLMIYNIFFLFSVPKRIFCVMLLMFSFDQSSSDRDSILTEFSFFRFFRAREQFKWIIEICNRKIKIFKW